MINSIIDFRLGQSTIVCPRRGRKITNEAFSRLWSSKRWMRKTWRYHWRRLCVEVDLYLLSRVRCWDHRQTPDSPLLTTIDNQMLYMCRIKRTIFSSNWEPYSSHGEENRIYVGTCNTYYLAYHLVNWRLAMMMMMIACITIKKGSVPFIKGLCAQIYHFKFENISRLPSLLFFLKRKDLFKKKTADPRSRSAS